ncbi:uncharacterized protein ASCRUDRAFT_5944 [Ascoidea rubescens DSM 1968]|uniref:Uncharacterized protein n=1 Tax=Ascoidea rubescens DSM 1968 TaxID=1344418 RepID=A0A1D2VR31_9ASCO|nr:hypothetical protein ASCRUDRAFT_5944 [Ascoidea rubescens DSM 1968]ODV64064.1 hypothetical protein ASCRUDRAFT_5944 [Ascoidea rubescens DSM 1968]
MSSNNRHWPNNINKTILKTAVGILLVIRRSDEGYHLYDKTESMKSETSSTVAIERLAAETFTKVNEIDSRESCSAANNCKRVNLTLLSKPQSHAYVVD